MPRYVDADFVRRFVDILTDELDDIELEEYVDDAQEWVVEDITSWVIHEEMVDEKGNAPDIDGSNKLFYTVQKNIADIDFDSVVNANDVTVYEWSDKDDETTATASTVSLVNADTGLIQLTTAPITTIEKVTCTYRFYLTKPNFVVIKIAVALMAGILWVRRNRLLYPDRTQVGAYRWQFSEPAYNRLMQEYIKTTHMLKSGFSQAPDPQLPWNDPKIIAAWYAEVGGRD
jgi:hypothetical protein